MISKLIKTCTERKKNGKNGYLRPRKSRKVPAAKLKFPAKPANSIFPFVIPLIELSFPFIPPVLEFAIILCFALFENLILSLLPPNKYICYRMDDDRNSIDDDENGQLGEDDIDQVHYYFNTAACTLSLPACDFLIYKVHSSGTTVRLYLALWEIFTAGNIAIVD